MGDQIYLNPPGYPVLPALPDGLLTKPTLLCKVSSKKEGKQDCEISYLTSGMGWHADYIVVTSPKDDKMDLNAWVTIDNNSGGVYKDAKLKLVAGDVHRAPHVRCLCARQYAKPPAWITAAKAPGNSRKKAFSSTTCTLLTALLRL